MCPMDHNWSCDANDTANEEGAEEPINENDPIDGGNSDSTDGSDVNEGDDL